MNSPLSSETDVALPNYTEFWGPAETDHAHGRLARRSGRVAIIGFSVATGLLLFGLANRAIDRHPVGTPVAPVVTEPAYTAPQTTTTAEAPCIAELRAEVKINPTQAHINYQACRDNNQHPTASALAETNAQMTTTTPPRS